MSTTYEKAGAVINALVEKVMAQSHAELVPLGTTIDVIVARRENKQHESLPALNKDGHPVLAMIRITSLQDRARGMADAKLTIDDHAWVAMNDVRRTALIDHELEHLKLVKIKPTKKNNFIGGQKLDDLGRPCLKIRPHDWVLTGFERIVERHGDAAPEAVAFVNFRADFGQLNLFGAQVLKTLEGKSPQRAAVDALRKVSTPTWGIDKATIMGDGSSMSSDDLLPSVGKCKRCKVGHHADCKRTGCGCKSPKHG